MATSSSSYLHLPILTYLLLSLSSYSCSLAHAIDQQDDGFTFDLIYRDSPLSPLHDPSKTRHETITNSLRRSISRRKRLSDIQSELYTIPGEYVMKISIGTPPVDSLAIADTGSDLTWIQCNPCTQCNPQAPIFSPRNSHSYKHLSCKSRACAALSRSGTPTKCASRNVCEYHMSYNDQSLSNGQLSSETLTFRTSAGQAVPISNVAFGCGQDNKLTFNGNISGVVGLGGGPLSLVKQLSRTINGKFSYCLVPVYDPSGVPSRINFGSRAVVEGRGVVSVPLVHKSPDTYYYLTLKGIKVGKLPLTFSKPDVVKPPAPNLGNMIIDSGTTLTFLPRGFYEAMEANLRSVIKGQTTPDPQGVLSLCYKTAPGGGGIDFPVITFEFIGGNVDLPGSSTFYEVAEGVVCLTVAPTDDLAIFGNLAQANLLVGYDLISKNVSFKRTDCTKQ